MSQFVREIEEWGPVQGGWLSSCVCLWLGKEMPQSMENTQVTTRLSLSMIVALLWLHIMERQDKRIGSLTVLTWCPVVTDESGEEITFSICGQACCNNRPMPWSAYRKIHGSMFHLVKATGSRSLSALYDLDDATDHLPILCTQGSPMQSLVKWWIL